MDASPLLARLVAALVRERLDVVLIGNAAAAMLGAPVTTLDFDFMFRDTPTNMRKLKAVSASLGAVILRPFYPVSKLYRMVDDASGLQADFMPVIHGVRSFEGLRDRASEHTIGGVTLKVASLRDIIASKKAAGRDRDLAVLPVLEQTLEALQGSTRRKRS
jgi:predicted nucleotidyltransferase